ncbi:MAG: hypothetical protein K0S61_1854 [Anaerocolumna sp.]|jgi:hypothetical protein|nr:hypothetical protein [Anaerocolumna sp.]
MMLCPICKSEFSEGIEFCSTCKCSLVEALPEESKEPLDEHVVFLTNVRHKYEADIIEGILTSNNIKVLINYREAGSYLSIYMGDSLLGLDIYVFESDYETAKELIETEQEAGVEEEIKDFD